MEAEVEVKDEQSPLGATLVEGKTTQLMVGFNGARIQLPLSDLFNGAAKGTMLVPVSIRVKATVGGMSPAMIGVHIPMSDRAKQYAEQEGIRFRHGKYEANVVVIDTRDTMMVPVYILKEDLPGLSALALAAHPQRLSAAIAKHTVGDWFILPSEDDNEVIARLRKRIPPQHDMQQMDGMSLRAMLREHDLSADVSWVEDNREYDIWVLHGDALSAIAHVLDPFGALHVVSEEKPLEIHFLMAQDTVCTALIEVVWEAREPSRYQMDPLSQIAHRGTMCKFDSLALVNDDSPSVVRRKEEEIPGTPQSAGVEI